MKVILVASGKGGTGKTTFSAGVGMALAEKGKRVLAVDGDCGLRNLDLALGMSDLVVFTFADVISGVVPLERAAVPHPSQPNLFLLTAPSEPPTGSTEQLFELVRQAREMKFDYLFLDGPAGLPPEMALYAAAADCAAVVTTPENACIRGAESTARFLDEVGDVRLVVNRIRPNLIRFGLAENIDHIMDEIGLPLLGIIPEDEDVIACGNMGKSLLFAGKSDAARAIRNIARRVDGERVSLLRL